MQKYELLLVLPGTLDEKEAETRSNEILGLLKEKDDSAEIQEMGKNRLAYPIRQIRYGYFYVLYFEVETEELEYINSQLSLQRDLLRAIVSKFNAKPQAHQKIRYSSGVMSTENEENESSSAKATEDKGRNDIKEETVDTKITKEKEKPAKKVDMKDIDKKLDEILDSDDISSQI